MKGMIKINKKRFFALSLVIILYSVLYIGLKYKHKTELENMSSYDRHMKINKFVSEHNEKEPEVNLQTGNDSGYDGLMIVNQQELLKVVDVDSMLAIGNKIIQSTEDIINLSNECKSSDLESYFDLNKEKISKVNGITSIDTFISVINKIYELEDKNNVISKVVIEEGTIVNSDNGIRFNLTLKNNEIERSFYITINNLQLDNITLLWE